MNDSTEILVSAKKLRNKSIVAFIVFFIFIIAAIFTWKWIHKQPQIAGEPEPLRKVLALNETFFSTFLKDNHLAPTYPRSAAVKHVRVNGDIGLKSAFDTSTWTLKLVRSPGDTLLISLDDIKALPKTELVFNFKCIEGWSQITDWAGVKFSDFAAKYNLDAQTKMKYAGLVTPDKEYYVGIDMPSMMHPQTLLCYEMNGKPLPLNQGFPLRLIIPVKYGIKHLKRLGTLFFSNERPPDYWYEQGYDYYSGL
ncbi:MAG: molybdopterin-dependent oxidoreductase [Bacteroidota bacterium]|nr:molybdopterin-dependent oxidoreductase [Bacteroidota bacterium]